MKKCANVAVFGKFWLASNLGCVYFKHTHMLGKPTSASAAADDDEKNWYQRQSSWDRTNLVFFIRFEITKNVFLMYLHKRNPKCANVAVFGKFWLASNLGCVYFKHTHMLGKPTSASAAADEKHWPYHACIH